ncbi:MAG: leucine-rich repeat domain-containing protein [Bacteroidales bacterium]|nr:leucine-rich repeat domain-containing protein [Bacteroidales bacterium]
MKKFLLMAMLLIVGIASGRAREDVTINGIGYEIENYEAKVVSVDSDIVNLEIPEDIGYFPNVNEEGIIVPVVGIREVACYGHSNLQSVTIGEYVQEIGNLAFAGCSNLVKVENQSPLLSVIGEEAFGDCCKLESFDFGEGISESQISLGMFAFYQCRALQTFSLQFVKDVGAYCFEGCAKLESVPGSENVETFGHRAFVDCTALKEINIMIDGKLNSELFFGCCALENVTLSNAITEIGTYAFEGCKSLNEITLPDQLTGLGSGAFGGCLGLKSVELPATLTDMGFGCFEHCDNLESLTVLSYEPPQIGVYNDDTVDSEYPIDNPECCRVVSEGSDCVLYVPEGCVEAYSNAPGWKWFKTIKEIPTQGIESAAVETESEPMYYDLQGVKIVNPRPGSVVIRRQGSKSEKIIF